MDMFKIETLAKIVDAEPEQVKQALEDTRVSPEFLDDILSFHERLQDIIIRDADLEMYHNYRDYPDGRS